LKYAVLKQIEIIGEAANYLSEELKHQHDEIEWNEIIGARHLYVHHYNRIDWVTVWEIIHSDIPKLKNVVESLLNEL